MSNTDNLGISVAVLSDQLFGEFLTDLLGLTPTRQTFSVVLTVRFRPLLRVLLTMQSPSFFRNSILKPDSDSVQSAACWEILQ